MNFKLLLLGVFVASQIFAAWSPVRCEKSGDSLNEAQAKERFWWAWKCFPTFHIQLEENEQMMDDNRNIRQAYPTFAKSQQVNGVSKIVYWTAPIDRNASCDIPDGFIIGRFCVSGCYTPEQKIRFKSSDEAIFDAYVNELSEIITLDASSELKNLKFISSQVEHYITDLVPGTHDVLEFHTLSGGSLRVTHEHPLVDSAGRMRSASSLKIGEALVLANGDFDPIISIDEEQYFGKVYNLEVTNQNIAEKIIVAQGYLNGTLYYQNAGLRDINRVIFRANLIPDYLVN